MQEAVLGLGVLLRRDLDDARQLRAPAMEGLTSSPEPVAVHQVHDAKLVLGKEQLLHGHGAVEQRLTRALANEHAHAAELASLVVGALHLGVEVARIARREQPLVDLLEVARDLLVIGQIFVGSLQLVPGLVARRHQRMDGSLETVERQAGRGIEHLLGVLLALGGVRHVRGELHVRRVDAVLDLLPHLLKGRALGDQPVVLREAGVCA